MNRHISGDLNHNNASRTCRAYNAPVLESIGIECETGFAISGAEGECPNIDGWNDYGEM